MDIPVRLTPKGRMDADTDIEDVSNGNYLTTAKNIRHKTTGGNTGEPPQNILGNEFVYDVGSVSRQNKRVALMANVEVSSTPTITFRTSPNGLALTTAPISLITIDAALDNILSAVNTAITSFGGAIEIDRVITSADEGYIILELGGGTAITQGIDWVVEVSGFISLFAITQEAIPEGLTGMLHNIGSREINGNLFQEWTIQTNMPSTRIVTRSTNSTPIEINEETAHGLVDGDVVVISGIRENTNANGQWVVDIQGPNAYTLIGSTGNGNMFIDILSGAEYFSTGLIEITTTTPHGFSTGNQVVITGSDASANGIWIVTVTSTTTFVLQASTFVAPFGAGGTAAKTGTATYDALGLGEIGVAVKNQDSTWTYTRLLRSREFNFRTEKQIDNDAEIQNNINNLYFTDNYNPPRVFYYGGAFVTDGAIDFINSDGIYSYGTISEQLSVILKSPVLTVEYENQLQIGGALLSGNWRYSFSLLTENSEATPYSPLSPPINVYSENFSDNLNILGNEAGTLTSKANQIRVSGINTDFFKSINVVAVNYIGGSFSGQIIGTYPVTGTEMVITHYGTEVGQDLDLGLLNQITADIKTVLNNRILDNRLIYSNITSTEEFDLEDWALQTEYSLLRTPIQGIGGSDALEFGEYQDPSNVFSFTSYMLNETYRFGVKLRNRSTGAWTRPYFMIDVAFDDSAVSGRKLATIPDYDLTNTPTPSDPADDVYIYYIQFENFDWDFVLPNGNTVRQEYDYFSVVRSEVTTPTVILTGILMTQSDEPSAPEFIAGNSALLNASGTQTAPSIPYALAATNPLRQAGVFFSPDNIIGGQDVTFQAGDLLYTYGVPLYQFIHDTGAGGAARPSFETSVLVELYGAYATTFTSHDLDGVENISTGQTISITGTSIEAKVAALAASDANFTISTKAFKITGSFITDTAGLMANDFGIYQFQYIRPNLNPYGSTATTNYVDINATFLIGTTDNAATQYNVFGGDCFTEKSWIRCFIAEDAGTWGKIFGFYSQNRINSQMRNDTGLPDNFIYPKANGSNGVFNTRIDLVSVSTNTEPFEYNAGYSLPNLIQSNIAYNSLVPSIIRMPTRFYYSALKPASSVTDFYRFFAPLNFYDENASYGPIMGMFVVNGEMYSLQPYAFIKQFVNNRAELQAGSASPTILVGSGALFSQRGQVISTIGCAHKWAQAEGKALNGRTTLYWVNTALGKVMRFAADGTQNVSDVMLFRSFLANNLNWAASKDTPAAGQGICMVWDARYSQLYITVRAKRDLDTWNESTVFSTGDATIYTPDLYSRNFEQTGEIYEYIAIVATSGNPPTDTDFWRKISHDDDNYYNEYTLLYDEDRNAFECFVSFKPLIYLQWNDKILSPRPVGTVSRVYEHDRGFYCRWYVEDAETLTFVTKVAGSLTVAGSGTSFLSTFQTGYSFKAGDNTYIVVSVESDTSLTVDDLYLDINLVAQTGATALAFTNAAFLPISQQLEHGYIEPVLNYEPNSSKEFTAIMFNTELEPYFVNFTTPTQVSYLDSYDTNFGDREFTFREGFYYSTIKNDSTATGLNNGDTSRLFAKWLRVKLTYRYLLFQILNDIIVKVRINQRNFRK